MYKHFKVLIMSILALYLSPNINAMQIPRLRSIPDMCGDIVPSNINQVEYDPYSSNSSIPTWEDMF